MKKFFVILLYIILISINYTNTAYAENIVKIEESAELNNVPLNAMDDTACLSLFPPDDQKNIKEIKARNLFFDQFIPNPPLVYIAGKTPEGYPVLGVFTSFYIPADFKNLIEVSNNKKSKSYNLVEIKNNNFTGDLSKIVPTRHIEDFEELALCLAIRHNPEQEIYYSITALNNSSVVKNIETGEKTIIGGATGAAASGGELELHVNREYYKRSKYNKILAGISGTSSNTVKVRVMAGEKQENILPDEIRVKFYVIARSAKHCPNQVFKMFTNPCCKNYIKNLMFYKEVKLKDKNRWYRHLALSPKNKWLKGYSYEYKAKLNINDIRKINEILARQLNLRFNNYKNLNCKLNKLFNCCPNMQQYEKIKNNTVIITSTILKDQNINNNIIKYDNVGVLSSGIEGSIQLKEPLVLEKTITKSLNKIIKNSEKTTEKSTTSTNKIKCIKNMPDCITYP